MIRSVRSVRSFSDEKNLTDLARDPNDHPPMIAEVGQVGQVGRFFEGIIKTKNLAKDPRIFNPPYTPKKPTDPTDPTDRSESKNSEISNNNDNVKKLIKTSKGSVDSFLDYVFEWFLGPIKISLNAEREFGLLIGDMSSKASFRRDSMVFEGFRLLYWPEIRKRFYDSNIFMGVGYWETPDQDPIEENMLYDRLVYDFDYEEDPNIAIKTAYEFSKLIKEKYNADVIIVRSGHKGAHVYIPLSQPVKWDHYKALWRHILNLLPEERRNLCDPNMLQFNRLARIPMTVNYKDGKRSWAWMLQPKIEKWSDFTWDLLQPLDVSKVKIFIFKGFSLPQKINMNERLRRSQNRIDWIEDVIERGLPDGRKRILALAVIPYLINVLSLDDEEALEKIREFQDASCKNYGRCDEIKEKWILYEIKRIRSKGYGPIRFEKLTEDYKDLYELIESGKAGENIVEDGFPEELVQFVRETRMKEFTYEDFKKWLEKKREIKASEWHRWERVLRKLAEDGKLGRKFRVNNEWIDYGPGLVKRPPSKEVKFYFLL
jgi:hypothetical protein